MDPELKHYWQDQNALWEQSGLNQQSFCKQRGLSYNQFIYYRSELKRKEKPTLSSGLARVSISPALASPNKEDEGLEVILPMGIRLIIKTKADINRALTFVQRMGAL